MDYAKLLFAVEARKLALGMLNADMPDHYEADERAEHMRDYFPKYLEKAVSEFEYTAKLIDDARKDKASE